MGAKADDAPKQVVRGLLLDGRYRLDQVRADHRDHDVHAMLWRAVDESLERKVAILVVAGLDRAGRAGLLKAATAASRGSDSRFARVLDVGTLDLGRRVGCWLATEWVDAPSLAARLRDEPLRPAAATELVRQCADALAVADRDGLRHGRLHPDQVLLPPGAGVRITGLQVAAALHGEDTDDAVALGALLFAALTGRWPLPGWTGLPGVDPRVARQARPRLVRAGIGRDLDDVCCRALSGDYADARAVARALAALPTEPIDAEPPAPTAGRPSVVRRWAWRVVPPVVVLAIGLTGWALGSDLGRIPTTARQPPPALPPAQASAPGTGRASLVWHRPPLVQSFDPEGDGKENDDAAGLAVDRDPTTSWETDTYRGNPHFGGLKSGVGLLLDLRRPVAVSIAELALSAPGADVQIRAGNAAPTQANDLRLVSSATHTSTHPRMTFDRAVRARYWLVWFTSLPPDGGGYRVGVAEIALLG